MVSDVDRHVICFGADPLNASGTARTGAIDPLFIAFSDQENVAQVGAKNNKYLEFLWTTLGLSNNWSY